MRNLLILSIITLSLFTLVACQSGGSSRYQDAGSEFDADPVAEDNQVATVESRVVLFAPAYAGPLGVDDPNIRDRFPRDLANKLNANEDFVVGSYSNILPDSTAPEWDAGPVGLMAGAHLAVVTMVEKVEEASSGTITARVTMRAFAPNGKEIWQKTAYGKSFDDTSPKLRQPASQPASRAAWAAARNCLDSLRNYLDGLGNVKRNELAAVGEIEDLPLIEVAFDSIPPNADIIVNGVFRGNTPTVVPLPVKELEITIKRQGFEPWSQVIVPSPEIRIQPALEPLK